ncbi:MAG: PAS domain-containing sensor histidine kinase, partial [Spirochaetia bacterium]|nr:PAS domain-containing sensor histidine kinase [Spirochaetia bacterium]
LALEVQRQEEQFKLILEGVNIGVWRVCVDTGEVQVSKAGELLGFAPEKLEHLTIETFLDLIHPAEQSGLHRLLLDCLEGESNFLEHEFRMRHQDGCWTWVFAKGRMISQNELRQGRWFVAILVDISSRISAEQELQAMNNLLEERIAQRTEELNKVYAQLMQQEKMVALGQLAAGISHELNNPVNFIQINFATLQGYFTDFMELYRLYRESLEGLDTREHSPVRRALDKREQEIQLREILLDIPLLFDETERGFDRVAHIIGSMRNFSRQNKETVLEEVDINECIQDTITQLNDIENKSPVFKLITEIFRTRGKQIDEKFQLLQTHIKLEDNLRDFHSLSKLVVSVGEQTDYDVLVVKLQFLLFLFPLLTT